MTICNVLPEPDEAVWKGLIRVDGDRRRTCGSVDRIDSYVGAYVDDDIPLPDFIALWIVNLPDPDLIE
jgi:hypothetical protein